MYKPSLGLYFVAKIIIFFNTKNFFKPVSLRKYLRMKK